MVSLLSLVSVYHTKPKQRNHVRIYLNKPVPASFANMLQWLLLDDHGCVDFNRARINVGFDEWDKFFEDPRR